MTVVNPATEQTLAEVADATPADAARALQAAADAQPGWTTTPPRVRSEILYRTYQLMTERIDLLAEVMTLEMGKPLAEAQGRGPLRSRDRVAPAAAGLVPGLDRRPVADRLPERSSLRSVARGSSTSGSTPSRCRPWPAG